MPVSIHGKFYEHDWLWFGQYSGAHSDGPIYTFLEKHTPPNMILKVYRADGVVDEPNYPIARRLLSEVELTDAVGALSTRNVSDPRIILLPLDDATFSRGVCDVVSSECELPPWEERKPVAYWRGTMSGGDYPTIRTNVVWHLYQSPHADVKFIRRDDMGPNQMGALCYQEDGRFFDEKRSLADHVACKYIFIIDGNCIASAHQWVFASGSVPVMVTHPGNNYWLLKYLKPMVHYVPVNYDLSDLHQKLEWLVQNDAEAKQIAINAMEIARTVLSAEFQQEYLLEEINRVSALYANSPA
jgi:hypothetical protein